MLELILEDVEAAAAQFLKECKLLLDLDESGVPLVLRFRVRNHDVGCAFAVHKMRYKFGHELVGNESNDDGNR